MMAVASKYTTLDLTYVHRFEPTDKALAMDASAFISRAPADPCLINLDVLLGIDPDTTSVWLKDTDRNSCKLSGLAPLEIVNLEVAECRLQ
jgi:hypothetical protein